MFYIVLVFYFILLL